MNWEKQIKDHYKNQANEFGSSKQSTMKDLFIRNREVEEIIKCIQEINLRFGDDYKILDIGCGNGCLAEEIEKILPNKIIGIDFSEELLGVAKNRNLKNVTFQQGNALQLEFADNSFEIILTERCLINLESWENQKKALEEIKRILRPNGIFILTEAFTDGWENLNLAREALELKPIPQPFHNNFIKKDEFLSFIKNRFELVDMGQKYNFLSSYYFGARTIYPSLIDKKKELIYNNKFIEFFNYLPPFGNYSSIQIFCLKKLIKI